MLQKRLHLFTSLVFLALSAWLFIVPEAWIPPTVEQPLFSAIILLISPAFIYLPGLTFRRQPSEKKKRLVLNIQTAIAFALFVNHAGELGLYQLYRHGFEYDKFCHFIVPMLLAFLLAESLRAWERLSFWQTAWLTLGITLLSGLLWELLEFSSDFFFRTKVWGVYGHSVLIDTLFDVLFDGLGGIAGIIVHRIPSKYKIRKMRGIR